MAQAFSRPLSKRKHVFKLILNFRVYTHNIASKHTWIYTTILGFLLKIHSKVNAGTVHFGVCRIAIEKYRFDKEIWNEFKNVCSLVLKTHQMCHWMVHWNVQVKHGTDFYIKFLCTQHIRLNINGLQVHSKYSTYGEKNRRPNAIFE